MTVIVKLRAILAIILGIVVALIMIFYGLLATSDYWAWWD